MGIPVRQEGTVIQTICLWIERAAMRVALAVAVTMLVAAIVVCS